MKKIRRILLAVDGAYDRRTFIGEAATVAKDMDAQVTLLSVLDMPASDQTNTELSDLKRWVIEDNLELMQAISSELVKDGILVTSKQTDGRPYLEIIREAMKGDHDLVMKTAENSATVKNLLFGSTDMQLFRLCPCPVYVFKPTLNTELRRIMIAVDLLAYDEEKSTLADTVLQWGKYVAELVDAELHVVHIWDLYGEITLRGKSISSYTVDKLVKNEEEKHYQWLNEALVKNGIEQQKIQVHFYKGEAKKLIPEIANNTETDLLVMGTVGRTGIPGFFIGNTADAVLRQVNCSVLAIKPEGFVTPIKVE